MKKSTVLTWVAAGLVWLLILGIGVYFGYRAWFGGDHTSGEESTATIEARKKTAVETAAAFERALWTGDAVGLERALPPELVSAMTDPDRQLVAGIWRSMTWRFKDSTWKGEELVSSYSLEETTDGTTDFEITYTVAPGATAEAATVDYVYAVLGEAELADGAGKLELVWLDGAWRIARYRWEGEPPMDFAFYSEGASVESLIAALRATD